MADTRSTRRVIKPESDAPSIPGNTDFASVEGDHDAKQVANNKLNEVGERSTQEPARMQPPDSFQVNDRNDETAFDMDQLEEELNVAISAEMGEVTTVEPVDASEPSDSDASDEASNETVVIGTKNDETVKTAPVSEESVVTDEEGLGGVGVILGLVTKPFTAPVERLSGGARVILNFTAISLALWVPVVWLGAMTDGFGYLSSSQNGMAEIVTPATELDVVDSTTESGDQDDPRTH